MMYHHKLLEIGLTASGKFSVVFLETGEVREFLTLKKLTAHLAYEAKMGRLV